MADCACRLSCNGNIIANGGASVSGQDRPAQKKPIESSMCLSRESRDAASIAIPAPRQKITNPQDDNGVSPRTVAPLVLLVATAPDHGMRGSSTYGILSDAKCSVFLPPKISGGRSAGSLCVKGPTPFIG